MKPIKYLILILISFYSAFVYSQTSKENFAIAETLFNQQQYEQAIKLYNRIAYFDDDLKALCFYRIAVSNFNQAKYYLAEDYFEIAYQNSKSDSLSSEIVFDKIMLFIFSGKYEFAQAELYSLNDNQIEDNFYKYQLFHGLAALGKGNYSDGRNWLDTLLNNAERNKLDKLIKKSEKWDKRKPQRAFLMSLAVPGSGQLRYGYKEEAINSFALNGALAIITYIVYSKYSLLDAFLTIVPWLQRYYLGGAFKAEVLANAKQLQIHKQIISDTIEIIQKRELSD